jgi:hypothetical protein
MGQQSIWSPMQKVHIIWMLGIPIKKSAGITPERALHISFLINDYWATTKKIVHNDLKMGDVLVLGYRTLWRRYRFARPSSRRLSLCRLYVSVKVK